MGKKPIVIVVEDDENWLKELSDILENYFEVDIEPFKDFALAEIRIMAKPANFNLLVTDIFPSDKSRETRGLKLANFVKEISNVPVIVVTGELEYVIIALADYKVSAAFDKGKWDKMKFINSVDKEFKSMDFTSVRKVIESGSKNQTNENNKIINEQKNVPPYYT